MGKPRIRSVDTSFLKVPQFCCDVKGCNKFFSKLSRLKYHQNIHLEEKPYKCDFEGCSSAYYRPNHLKRHIESVHKSCQILPRDFACSEAGCGAVFENESSLYFHSKRKHSVQPLQCSFCDKKFSKKWMFKEHESSHTGAWPFKCDVETCGESFRDYNLFKIHKRDHEKKSKQKSYNCPAEGCKLSFSHWSELVEHKKASHQPESQCNICNKIFTKGNLKHHLKIHEEERDTLQCPFEGCPRFYFHQKNLSHHMRIKHEGFGFECSICNRKLSTKQKLNQHIDVIHKNNGKRKSKKKKNAESVLNKLGTMSVADWDIKKTGPPRYVRQKYDCIKFPEASEDKVDIDRDLVSSQHECEDDMNK